jgi:hypothetical protein
LTATINVQTHSTGPDLGRINDPIIAGTTMTSDINVPAGGLRSQVIINEDQIAGGTWDPGAVVTVGGVPLSSPPYYTNDSDTLGGGAVGLAPFHFYPADCSPPHHDFRLLTQFSTGNPVYLTFYGPVAATSSDIASIDYHVPYRCYDDASGNWKPADGVFDIVVDSVNPRRLKITPKVGMIKLPGEYRVRTSNLVCVDTTGAPLPGSPAPQSAEYYFGLAVDCNQDMAGSAADFLVSYSSPCTPSEPNLEVDCDRMGSQIAVTYVTATRTVIAITARTA